MRNYSNRFEGSFQCNEINNWNYNGICAYFSNHWFNIPYLETGSSKIRSIGPQLKVECLNTMFIVNSLGSWNGDSIKLHFSGNYLGFIDSFHGYVAFDMGRGKFLITQLTFEMVPKKHGLHINVSGSCERNYCSSIPALSGKHPHFNINFVVGVSELAELFPDLNEEFVRKISQTLFENHQ